MNGFTDQLDNMVPTIAATIAQELDDAAIDLVTDVARVIEYRLDLAPNRDTGYLVDQAQRLTGSSLLVTPRLKVEGGEWVEDGAVRFRLFEDLMTEVEGLAAVDVELDSPILADVVAMAHERGIVVVGSSHDFKGTPTMSTFERKFETGKLMGVDYVKFATKLRTEGDFIRLMKFTALCHPQEVISVGMGEKYGPTSRLLLPFLGSCMTYAYFGEKPLVAGQLECIDMHRRFLELSADYATQFTGEYAETAALR